MNESVYMLLNSSTPIQSTKQKYTSKYSASIRQEFKARRNSMAQPKPHKLTPIQRAQAPPSSKQSIPQPSKATARKQKKLLPPLKLDSRDSTNSDLQSELDEDRVSHESLLQGAGLRMLPEVEREKILEGLKSSLDKALRLYGKLPIVIEHGNRKQRFEY